METNSKTITQVEVLKAIEDSGYPFELTVAKQFLEFGYEVQPGFRFFDKNRQKDVEVDIQAMLKKKHKTKKGNPVEIALQLQIECKDNSLPFVFFGLNHTKIVEPGTMDPDWQFVHVNTSRDKGYPNRHGIGCFLNDKGDDSFKKQHHQFASETRFYRAASFEWKNKNLKLSETDNLVDALRKHASFIDYFHSTWIRFGKETNIEEMNRGIPCIFVVFLLIVHSGQQFQYSFMDKTIKETDHTSVFQNYHVADQPVHFVVDFVAFKNLASTVEMIESSLASMLKIIVPTVFADTKEYVTTRPRD